MSDPAPVSPALAARSGGVCELCGGGTGLVAWPVPPRDEQVVVCEPCRGQLSSESALDPKQAYGLRTSAWSEVPAVQVLAWRWLGRLASEGWARELRDQLYLDDELSAWAREGEEPAAEAAPTPVDANGAALADGDAVSLIKDLEVKGAHFTAKRGTVVKGIRLTDDPGLVEGRVNGTTIVLKTQFLKKA